MKKRLLKLMLLLILPLVPFTGISNAQLYDTENSAGNSFTAASLDIKLSNESGDEFTGSFFDKSKLKSEEELTQKINVMNSGTLNFYYHPEFGFKDGNNDVCGELALTASKEGNKVYEGDLKDFNLATESAQITSSTDEWEFTLNHENSDESLQGEFCEFDIAFVAYQNIDRTGFSDTDKVANKVRIAYEPTVSISHNALTHEFIFVLSGLVNFTSYEYGLNYDTDTISDYVKGGGSLNGENTKTTKILLGTCSSENNCTYQINPHDFELRINLTDIDGDVINLSKHL